MRGIIACGVVALLAGGVGARGGVINGGFEAGAMTGWAVTGYGHVQTAASGVVPTAGGYEGELETTGNFTAVRDVVLAALGVPGSEIAAFGVGVPVNGTGISQSVTVGAGDVLTFDWNFATDELNESATFNDFAFFTIESAAYLLASRNGSTYDTTSPPAGFDGQTGWGTMTYTFAAAGTYTIGFGALNVGDSGHNSALFLDGVSVPEPGVGMVLVGGMGVIGGRRRRG